MSERFQVSGVLIGLSTLAFLTILVVAPLLYIYLNNIRIRPPKIAPNKYTPAEEALLSKLKLISMRLLHSYDGAKLTPLPEWTKQLKLAVAEVTNSPAGDGGRRAYAERKHLGAVRKLMPTIEADLAGCVAIESVIALDRQMTFDKDGDGDFDENDIVANKIDLSPIYALEKAVKSTTSLKVEAMFVGEAERLLERRQIERDIIEGIKEMNDKELRAALKKIDSRKASSKPIYILRELEAPARRVLRRLEIEDHLEDAIDARSGAELTAAINEARVMGELVEMDQLRERFNAKLRAAEAMLDKLAAFGKCQHAVDNGDAEGLRSTIGAAQSGWWKAEHWYEEDKAKLKSFQLALKRLTVLVELQQHMEPLNVGALQGALDTARQVKVSGPLVDKAAEILKSIDRESTSGAFTKPYDSGGAFGNDEWLSNPHFKVSFKGGDAAPKKVRISITCVEGEGDADGKDNFGAFALHVVRMPGNPSAHEAQPGFELLASSEYSYDTAVLTLDDLDCAGGCFIIPSTQVAGEEGPFTLNVLCETPHADLVLEPVVQIGDLMLQAIAADDLTGLQKLLDRAKKLDVARVQAIKGQDYLSRRKFEERLRGAVVAQPPSMQALQLCLRGASEANVPPSLLERAEALLATLLAAQELDEARKSGDWERMDRAINGARLAKVAESKVEPYVRPMLEARGAARLRTCLAKGEDGYTTLQACYDDAVLMGLGSSADAKEAELLLTFLSNSQRFLRGEFAPWMGGGYQLHEPMSRVGTAPAAGVRLGAGQQADTAAKLPRWLDNPQYKLVIGGVTILKMQVSVDRAGDASFAEYAVHVVKVTGDAGAEAEAEAMALQVGPRHEVVASTPYLLDSEHEGSTASLTFEAEADATYFIVPSTKATGQTGGFSLTTIGVGEYTLDEVSLVQGELRRAMDLKTFDLLPELVDRAESAVVDLAQHPLVARSKLVSEMEFGWQQRSADAMTSAITAAKRAKVDKDTLKLYAKRARQLSIEAKLRRGMAGNIPLLHAACEEAKVIDFDGVLRKEAEEKLKQYTCRFSMGSLFGEDSAAGSRRFGSWRENPTFRLRAVGGRKCTIYVAVNEDGELSATSRAKLERREAREKERHAVARDKMAAMQAAALADVKNEELAAAAKEAARVFGELDDARQRRERRQASIDDDEGGGALTRIGVHVVRNTRDSWIPGVLSNYEDLSLPAGADKLGDDVYNDGQAYCAFEMPADGDAYVVPSTWLPGEEGIFTLSLMSSAEFSVDEVDHFDTTCLKLKGVWTSANQGPRSSSGKEDGKSFKAEKTWHRNPQFRVWLRDPETNEAVTGPVGLSITVSTPIEGAEVGMHVMRNAFCQFHNEKIEVLADRYQRVAGFSPHTLANELTYEISVDDSFEVRKNGCEPGFPFFIVPSLMDKKMAGPFMMTIYSDKGIVVQMLDDASRKI